MKSRNRERKRWKKCHPPPFSELLGGTVGHAFSHMHTYPPHSSWTDNWTVLWRIWTLKGNLSHLIIGIQRMLFICINTNKTHSLPAQREPHWKGSHTTKHPYPSEIELKTLGGGVSEYSLSNKACLSWMAMLQYHLQVRKVFFLLIFWTQKKCWADMMPLLLHQLLY